jgi:O-antigen biosynthesis protein
MTLSIIIVNYNVKYFLEEAVRSSLKACDGLDAEVIVVDNNSIDGSVAYISSLFPQITVISNKDNPGFSKANNQGIKIAKGKYVLILNPDTIVAEDCFKKCISFMESHPDCGSIGSKMIDGSGSYLPESKRALPTPSVSFYKLSGLTKLLPTHKTFAEYYLGNLSSDETCHSPVLPGAFMFIRKELLDKTGGFDETFFMYGEDIDLSYRLEIDGFKNYFVPDIQIIHFKGESTKKADFKYYSVFYNAMLIFVNKHFKGGLASLYLFFIKIAILLRGSFSYIASIFQRWNLFIVDFLLSFAAIEIIKIFWATNVKGEATYYPHIFSYGIVPVYLCCWCISVYLCGGYEKLKLLYPSLNGIVIGSFIIATAYAFLPENFRYSRAIILLGAISTLSVMIITRLVSNFYNFGKLFIIQKEKANYLIVGCEENVAQSLTLLKSTVKDFNFIGRVFDDASALGNISRLSDLIKIFNIDTVLYSSKSISYHTLIKSISNLNNSVSHKIMTGSGNCIIGSDSKNDSGELFDANNIYTINTKSNIRQKRLFDVISSVLILLLSPLFILLNFSILKSAINVLFHDVTWIGYINQSEESKLPKLKSTVLDINTFSSINLSSEMVNTLNRKYASDYSIWWDFRILWKKIFK